MAATLSPITTQGIRSLQAPSPSASPSPALSPSQATVGVGKVNAAANRATAKSLERDALGNPNFASKRADPLFVDIGVGRLDAKQDLPHSLQSVRRPVVCATDPLPLSVVGTQQNEKQLKGKQQKRDLIHGVCIRRSASQSCVFDHAASAASLLLPDGRRASRFVAPVTALDSKRAASTEAVLAKPVAPAPKVAEVLVPEVNRLLDLWELAKTGAPPRLADLQIKHAAVQGATAALCVDRQCAEDCIAAVEGAKKFVNLRLFELADGLLGRKLLNTIRQKAGEGVEIRIIVCSYGSSQMLGGCTEAGAFVAALEDAGATVIRAPIWDWRELMSWGQPLHFEHCKTISVDGEVAMLGGWLLRDDTTYSREFVERAKREKIEQGTGPLVSAPVGDVPYIHDSLVTVRGAIAQQIDTEFFLAWLYYGGELHPDWSRNKLRDTYFGHTEAPPMGDTDVELIQTLPGNYNAGYDRLIEIVDGAKHTLDLEFAYLTGRELPKRLLAKADAGVHVRLLLPEQWDNYSTDPVVFGAARRLYAQLVNHPNVEVRLLKNRYNHLKVVAKDLQYPRESEILVTTGNPEVITSGVRHGGRTFDLWMVLRGPVADEFKTRVFDCDLSDAASYKVTREDIEKLPWWKVSLDWLWSMVARSQDDHVPEDETLEDPKASDAGVMPEALPDALVDVLTDEQLELMTFSL